MENISTISDTDLKAIAQILLNTFKPHNLLQEFQNIDPRIEKEVSSLKTIQRYLLGTGKQQNIRLIPNDLLQRDDCKQLICAHGGAGKTYVLWSLGDHLNAASTSIPIFISLRDFSSIDEIDIYLNKLKSGLSISLISQNENVIFLFDGLTEFSRENNQSTEIRKLFGLLRESVSISTSRNLYILPDNESWNLELISQVEITKFLTGAGVNVGNIDSSLFELLSYPLMLILYVLLSGNSSTVDELFLEYFNRLTIDVKDRSSLLKILSQTVMEMETHGSEMKWITFETKYHQHCESQGMEHFKPLLDKIGLFNKRGVSLEPIHDLYWEWLVGCGLLYNWNSIKTNIYGNINLRKNLFLSLNTSNCPIPNEAELLDLIALDIILAANFYSKTVTNPEYENFTRNFKIQVNNGFNSIIQVEVFRSVIASISSDDEELFDKAMQSLKNLLDSHFNVGSLSETITNQWLWKKQCLVAKHFSTYGDIYILREVIEKSGEYKWANWAENLFLEGKIEFKIAMSIYFSCSDNFPDWIKNRLLEFLPDRNHSWLRAAAKRGRNLKLAYWLLENYAAVCPKDNSSGWVDVNGVLVNCGDDTLFETITDKFHLFGDRNKELISFALRNKDKKWISVLQPFVFSTNISDNAKHNFFYVVDESHDEQILRKWTQSNDRRVVEMGWRCLAKKMGLAVLDELISELPKSFANIHVMPTLKAIPEIKNLPESLIDQLSSRLGSPMTPMGTQDYIFAIGSIKPHGILTVFNMIRHNPFIFGEYHFNIFAKLFSEWSKVNGIKLMIDYEGSSFTAVEYFLLLQLNRPKAIGWFDLVTKYAKHNLVYDQMAIAINNQVTSSQDISNLSMPEYRSSVYDALRDKVDSIKLYVIHQNSLDTIPSEKLKLLSIDIFNSHPDKVSQYMYHLSRKPTKAHIGVYSEIILRFSNLKVEKISWEISYVSNCLSVLEKNQIIELLSPHLANNKKEIIGILRLIESQKGIQLLNEECQLV